jgi:hypothetical protein
MNFTSASNQTPGEASPISLSAMIENLECEVVHASKVLEQATSVADRLVGGMPRPVENATKDAPESGNMLVRIQARSQRLFTLHAQISDQLTRIGNAL